MSDIKSAEKILKVAKHLALASLDELQWDEVVASAYRGNRRSLTKTLAHINNGGDGSICGHIPDGNLCGMVDFQPEEDKKCPRCLKSLEKINLSRK